MKKQPGIIFPTPLPFFCIKTPASTGYYTTAAAIENYAGALGAKIRYDPDGSRHPGSVCNHHISLILADSGSRKHFQIGALDCIQIDGHQTNENAALVRYIQREFNIHPKNSIFDLYSSKAAAAIIASMTGNTSFALVRADIEILEIPYVFDITAKKLTPKNMRPANSLIDNMRKTIAVRTVYDDILDDIQKEYDKAMSRQHNGLKPSGCMRGLSIAQEIVLKYKAKEK